jgi:hypothetical protein
MKRINDFNKFLLERDLNSPEDKLVAEEISHWVEQPLFEASFMDTIKNTLGKALGPFSKISSIDKIREGNLAIEKELVSKKYELRDKLDSLELKLDEVRKRANKAAVISVENEIDKVKEEYRTFVKNRKAVMERGMELLKKAISGKERLKEYYKAGKAEDDVELSEMEYELAKKKSGDAGEIENLRKSLEAAKKEADEIVKRFSKENTQQQQQQQQTNPNPKKRLNLSRRELVDLSVINKIINGKNGSEIEQLRKLTGEFGHEHKLELIDMLVDLAQKVDVARKKGLKPNKMIDKAEEKAIKMANDVDSAENLRKVYKTLGNLGSDIEAKLSSSSELSSILAKINKALMDGQDANSGTTSQVIATFGSNPTLTGDNLRDLVKKVK